MWRPLAPVAACTACVLSFNLKSSMHQTSHSTSCNNFTSRRLDLLLNRYFLVIGYLFSHNRLLHKIVPKINECQHCHNLICTEICMSWDRRSIHFFQTPTLSIITLISYSGIAPCLSRIISTYIEIKDTPNNGLLISLASFALHDKPKIRRVECPRQKRPRILWVCGPSEVKVERVKWNGWMDSLLSSVDEPGMLEPSSGGIQFYFMYLERLTVLQRLCRWRA